MDRARQLRYESEVRTGSVEEESAMKAAVYHAPKQPHTIEEVEIDHPKGTEVLVKIMASGVCHSDHVIWSGHRAVFAPPMILGHEVAGIVEEVGPQVTSVKPG